MLNKIISDKLFNLKHKIAMNKDFQVLDELLLEYVELYNTLTKASR